MGDAKQMFSCPERPWEEDWNENGLTALANDRYSRTGPGLDTYAKMVLAAPAIVRLLLEAEWESCESAPYDGCEAVCPWCRGDKPWTRTNSDGEPRTYGGHAPDCRFVATLVAAGVRATK